MLKRWLTVKKKKTVINDKATVDVDVAITVTNIDEESIGPLETLDRLDDDWEYTLNPKGTEFPTDASSTFQVKEVLGTNTDAEYSAISKNPFITNEVGEDEVLNFPILFANTINEQLPFGDGSNKVFGYENFGNTCYCNSVLQCLYNLPEFRLNILQYPERNLMDQRVRKLEMPGYKPRCFSEASFEKPQTTTGASVPAQDANNNQNNTTTANGNNNSNNFKTPSAQNKNIFKGLFGYGNSKINTEPLSQMADSSTSTDLELPDENIVGKEEDQHEGEEEEGNNNHDGQPIDQEIKLLPNSHKIIIGRTPPVLNPNTRNNSQVSGASNNDLLPVHISTEQRKKTALIEGPILTIDHLINSFEPSQGDLYNTLKDLFECITEHSSLTGIVSPVQFVNMLRRENVLFDSMMHQDAHEFLNFMLNDFSDRLDRDNQAKNFINEIFQGTLTNKVRCLTCDNVTSREEAFLDLPIEVKENGDTDIQRVLKYYSQREMLNGSNKFNCSQCCALQEAERAVELKKLPDTLILHLKRFKYSEQQLSNIKLFSKVYYPLILEVNSNYKCTDTIKYELSGIVIHVGDGPQMGHYVALCKTEKYGWLFYDDETVESVSEETVLKFIGDEKTQSTAYVLFYKKLGDKETNIDHNPEQFADNFKQLIKYDDRWRLRKKSMAQFNANNSNTNNTNHNLSVHAADDSYNEVDQTFTSTNTEKSKVSRLFSFMK